MKKYVTTISFLLIWFAPDLKAQDAYSDTIDSLLVSMGKIIFNDLTSDSIKIHKRPYIGFGDSFEFKVFFDAKRSVILTYLHRPDSIMMNKINKRKYQFRYTIFRDYIHDHNELPYDSFDSFGYKFLQVQLKGESFADALFGEYRFKATPKGLSIISKKIEILKGENTILKKHNSDW